MKKMMQYRVKSIRGVLIKCPSELKNSGYDFLFRTNSGENFYLVCNKKAYRMWNLVDMEIQVTGLVGKGFKGNSELLVLTYKCVDDYISDDWRDYEDYELQDFDIKRLDYAI